MRAAQVPVPAPLAVLRFPRTLPQRRGWTGATTPTGELVMVFDASQRGRQVDVSGPAGEPLGRMVFTGRHRWVLVAPHTAVVLAEATTRAGVQVSVGGGPWARVRGYGEPPVVAFVVHVWRVWQAAESSNQFLLQQTLTAASLPPSSS